MSVTVAGPEGAQPGANQLVRAPLPARRRRPTRRASRSRRPSAAAMSSTRRRSGRGRCRRARTARSAPGATGSVSAPTLSGCRVVGARQFGQGRAQLPGAGRAVFGQVAQAPPRTRGRSHRSPSAAMPAFCTSATSLRRSLSATRSLAAAWMCGRSSAPTTHSVRRIARCLTSAAPLVERGVEIGDGEAGQPRPQRQVRRGGVGGVQPDEVRDGPIHRAGRRSQEMPPRQPCPPFGVGERPHRLRTVPRAPDKVWDR